MEKTIEVLERHCHENMNHAIETEEGLGIEYDEDVICDVCRSPDSEEGNDMVFCDKCNVCVHQVSGNGDCPLIQGRHISVKVKRQLLGVGSSSIGVQKFKLKSSGLVQVPLI